MKKRPSTISHIKRTLGLILPIALIASVISLVPFAPAAEASTKPTKIKLVADWGTDDDTSSYVGMHAELNGNITAYGGDEELQIFKQGTTDPVYSDDNPYGNVYYFSTQKPTNVHDKYYAQLGTIKSNTIDVAPIGDSWGLKLTNSADEFSTDDPTPTLSWHTNQNISSSNYGLYVFDETTDTKLYGSNTAGEDATVSINRFYTGDAHMYVAYIADWSPTVTHAADLTNIQVSSSSEQVDRTNWTVTQKINKTDPNTIHITTNQSIQDSHTTNPTFAVYLLDMTTGDVVAENSTMSTTWDYTLTSPANTSDDTYIAVVAGYDSTPPTSINTTDGLSTQFPNFQASSKYAVLTGAGWNIDLSSDSDTYATDQETPAVNWSVDHDLSTSTSYGVYLVDQDNNIVARTHTDFTTNGDSTTGSFTPTRSRTSQTYVAYVATWSSTAAQKSDLTNIQAISESIEIDRTPWSFYTNWASAGDSHYGADLNVYPNQPLDSSYEPTGYELYLIDTTTNNIVATQTTNPDFDYRLLTDATTWNAAHDYRVYVADISTTATQLSDLQDIAGKSRILHGSDAAWYTGLYANTWDTLPSISYIGQDVPNKQYYATYLVNADTGNIVDMSSTTDPEYKTFNLPSWSSHVTHYRSYIAKRDTTAANVTDLTDIVATSETIDLGTPDWYFNTITVNSDNKISWALNRDLADVPAYTLYFVDTSNNHIVGRAQTGASGTFTPPNSSQIEHYKAYIAATDASATTSADLTDIAQTSDTLTVAAAEYVVSLSANTTTFQTGDLNPQLTWHVTQSGAITDGHEVYIVDTSDGTIIGTSNNSGSVGTDTKSGYIVIPRFYYEASHTYKAYIADADANATNHSDLNNVVGSSSDVTISHTPWTVDFTETTTSNSYYPIIQVTTNQSVFDSYGNGSNYAVYVVNESTNQVVAEDYSMGKTDTINLTQQQIAEDDQYKVYVGAYQPNQPTTVSGINDVLAESGQKLVHGVQWELDLAAPTTVSTNQQATFQVASSKQAPGNFWDSYYLVDETQDKIVGWTWFASGNYATISNVNTYDNHPQDVYRAYIASSTWGAAQRPEDLQNILVKSAPVTVNLDTNWQVAINTDNTYYRYGDNQGAFSIQTSQPLGSYFATYAVNIDTGAADLVNPTFGGGTTSYYSAPQAWVRGSNANYKVVIAKRADTHTTLAQLTDIVAESNSLHFVSEPMQMSFAMSISRQWDQTYWGREKYIIQWNSTSDQEMPLADDGINYGYYLVDETTGKAYPQQLVCESSLRDHTTNPYKEWGFQGLAAGCNGGTQSSINGDGTTDFPVGDQFAMVVADVTLQTDSNGNVNRVYHTDRSQFESIFLQSATINPTYYGGGGDTLDDTTGGGDLSTTNCSSCSGDPINTFTGEFYENDTDAAINNGIPFNFTRSYSSPKAATLGSLGYGWTNNYEMNLKGNGSDLESSSQITVTQENNSTLIFEKINGSYVTSPHVHATLTYNADTGNFVLNRENTYRFKFNSDGKLIEIKGINDHLSLNIGYNTDGKLASITAADDTHPNDTSKEIEVNWTDNLITSVVDDTTGNTTYYTYNSDNQLTNVNTPKAANDLIYTYYGDNRVHTFKNTFGGITTNTYDSSGRVISQTDPETNTTQYAYSPDSSGNQVTTITYQDGTIDKDYYNTQGELTQQTKAADTSDEATVSYGYDFNGQRIQTTDAEGNVNHILYNPDGTVESTTDPLNRTTSFDYNSNEQVTEITNPKGDHEHLYYDDNGTLKEQLSFNGKETDYDNNDNGTIHIATDPNQNQTKYGYNTTTGALETITDPLTNVTHIQTNTAGDPENVKDDSGNETDYTYDTADRLSEVDFPSTSDSASNKSDVAQSYYPGSGAVKTTTDRLGNITTYHYNKDGSIKTIVSPTGTTSYTYNHRLWVETETDSNSGTTTYTYDGRGNVISTEDPDNNITSETYYKTNMPKTSTDGEGHTTSYYYDPVGNLLRTTDANGVTTYATYDELNRVTSSINGIGQKVLYAYDKDGNVTEMTGTDNRTTDYVYDDNGNLIGYKAPDGHHESYKYDKDGNLIGYSPNHGYDPNGTYEYTYAYNNLNQLETSTANNLKTTYDYNHMGQVKTAKTYDKNNVVSSETDYTYSKAGQLLTETKDGSETVYTYDDNGNLTYRGPPISGTNKNNGIQYHYNTKDELDTLTYPNTETTPNQTKVHYTYDNDQNLSTVSLNDDTTNLAAYTYNHNGALTTADYGNNTTNILTYNNVGDLTTNTYTNNNTSTPTTLYNENLTIDSAGFLRNNTTSDDSGATKTKTYDYNPSNQLIQATTTGATNVGYTFDAMGNLTLNGNQTNTYSTTTNTTTKAQLTTSTTGNQATTYTYNTDGNLGRKTDNTTVTSDSATTTTNHDDYTWNDDGTLSGISVTADGSTNPTSSNAYTYDANGLLTSSSKTTNDGTTTNNLVWDESGSTPALLQDSNYDYIYGTDSTPFAQINHITGAITYLATNYLGSVILTTDGNGNKVSTYTYDAFGKTTDSTGDTDHIITAFGYAGQYLDANSGLYYMRARWYDPNIGSFLSIDPLLASTHEAYGYADANPVTNIDPTGMSVLGDLWNNTTEFVSGEIQNAHNIITEVTPTLHNNSFVQFGIGTLNGITAGGSTKLLNLIAPGVVNKCDSAFSWGNTVGVGAQVVGMLVMLAVPGGGEAADAGIIAADVAETTADVADAASAAADAADAAEAAADSGSAIAEGADGVGDAASGAADGASGTIRAGGYSNGVSAEAVNNAGSNAASVANVVHTASDVDKVVTHLKTLEAWDDVPFNVAQVNRIRDTMSTGSELTEGQFNFLNHELKESELMSKGLSYDDAHAAALTLHKFGQNYEPEIYQEFSGYFGRAYNRVWDK